MRLNLRLRYVTPWYSHGTVIIPLSPTPLAEFAALCIVSRNSCVN